MPVGDDPSENPADPAPPGSFVEAYRAGALDAFFEVAPGDVASALARPRPIDRSGLVDELRRQAERFAAPEAARAAIERLAHPEARVVATGQQAGVLLGPSYTLSKAVSAIRLASRLDAAERPVVPVFWIASQDHDTAEVDHAWILDLEERLTRVALELPGDVPVGKIPLATDAADVLLDQLDAVAAPDVRRAEVAGLLRRTLAGAGDPATWFGRLLSELLGPAGLIVFDPLQPGAARLARPILEAELAAPGASVAAVQAAGERLEAEGYAPQLGRADDATNLFLERPGAAAGGLPTRVLLRRAAATDGAEGGDGPRGGRGGVDDGEHGRSDATLVDPMFEPAAPDVAEPPMPSVVAFEHAGVRLDAAEVRARLADDPTCVTPAAGLRPVVQDFLLPTVATVVGPGELRYLAQLRGVYRHHGVAMPLIWPRAEATVLEPPVRRILERYELDAATVRDDLEGARDAVVLERAGEAERFETALARLAKEQAELQDAVRAIDPTLERTVEKQARHVRRAVDTLRRKSARALADRDETTRRQFERLERHLLPNGAPQERVLSPFSFFLKFGVDAVVAAFLGMEASGRHELEL